jgi:hypothetical protein
VAAILTIISFAVTLCCGGVCEINDTLWIEQGCYGSFENAFRMTLGVEGIIYIIDASRNELIALREDDSKSRSIGGFGWGGGSFDRPTGIASDGLNIYVSDFGNHRVLRFDRNLNLISALYTRDTSYSFARFGHPTGIALSRLGDLFILDSENLRVLKFSQSSRFERTFGEKEKAKGRIRNPIKIICSNNDHIYVLEPERILEYDYFGAFIRVIGDGQFSNAVSFDVSDNGFLVASEQLIYEISNQGILKAKYILEHILKDKTLRKINDLFIINDKIYLLSDRTLCKFTVTTVQ